MTILNLEELERLMEEATQGKLHAPGMGEIHSTLPDGGCVLIASIDFPHEFNGNEGGNESDAKLFAAAVNALPELIRRVRAAEEDARRDRV